MHKLIILLFFVFGPSLSCQESEAAKPVDDLGLSDTKLPSDLGRDRSFQDMGSNEDMNRSGDANADLNIADMANDSTSSEDLIEDVKMDVVEDIPPTPAMGSFSVLIYNVAGLPALLSSSDPATNIPIISPLLNAYDFVLVQEDFWYHTQLIAGVTLPYKSTPQDANPRVTNLHDGLNRFSKFVLGPMTRVTWNDCEGLSVTGNNDCFARKGFSVSEVELDSENSILVYNLHMDAGSSSGDIEARRRQSLQLAADIQTRANGRAIIVAGDFNMSARRPDDVTNFAAFLNATGLLDSCDAVNCTDNRIDKILFRASGDLNFNVLSRTIPSEFVDGNAEDLSDHQPVSIVLDWEEIQ